MTEWDDGYDSGYEDGLAEGYTSGEREHADFISGALSYLWDTQYRLKMGTYRADMDGGLLEVTEKVYRMLEGRA